MLTRKNSINTKSERSQHSERYDSAHLLLFIQSRSLASQSPSISIPSCHGFQIRQQYKQQGQPRRRKHFLLHFSMHSSQTVVVNFQFPLCSNLHEGTSVVLAPKLSIPSYTGYQGEQHYTMFLSRSYIRLFCKLPMPRELILT